MEWLLEGWKIGERKWYIWSFGWEGKDVRFWWGQEHQKSIFPFEEKTWEILVSFASVFTIIFLSSVLTYNVQHFNCYICPLICFVFFCPYCLLLDFFFILFIFLTLHFYHHTITFTACIFMFCAIPFQLAKVHDFFPQHGSIYWTIPFHFYLTKYNKFNYKEKK